MSKGQTHTTSHSFQNSSFYYRHFWLYHISLQNCQLTDSAQVAVSLQQTTQIQIVSDIFVIVAQSNYDSTDNITSLESGRNYITLGADASNVYTMRWFS